MRENHTPLDRGRVLVVDDDPLIRRLLAKIVRREGIAADTASDGDKAIGMLSKHHYDAVLLDLMMPKVSGYDVVDYLSERSSEDRPIVIVITAHGADEWRDLNPAVVTGIVRKPFEISDLGALLRLCIEHASRESNRWSSVPSLRLLRQ